MRFMLGAAMVAGMVAGPAFGESRKADFRVQLFGVPVGQMVLASNDNGSAYAAKGEFRTTGLVGLLARVRFTMSSHGRGSGVDLRPRAYEEDLDTGYRTSAAEVTFGASDRRIDPLSAILSALLDRDAAEGCTFDGQTYDGERSMQVRIRPAAEEDDDLVCTGRITRLSGYTAEEMAEVTQFPFTIWYEREGDRLVTVRANVDTIHGKVALVRR